MAQNDLPEDQLAIEKQQMLKAAIEHRDVLLAVRAVIATDHGKKLFKYLFKNFEVAEMAPMYLEGSDLHDLIGFRRAGTSIFKLASEADAGIAGAILAQIEKERQDEIYLRESSNE